MTNGQTEVLKTIKTYGPLPDAALVPVHQHLGGDRQSSSSIRTRRNELVKLRKVRDNGTIITPSGRRAVKWEAV